MSRQADFSVLSRKQQAEVLQSIVQLLNDQYVFAEVGAQAASKIISRMEQGIYDLNPVEFAEAVTRDLQAVTSDHHLRVVHDPVRIAKLNHPIKQRCQPDPAELARFRNHGFACVERLKGNIGYVDIRHFFAPSISGDFATAAMRLISDTDAIIIDLRNNTGGNPGMVQFLSSYFFSTEIPVHLNSITSRLSQKTTHYWTLPYVPGPRMLNTILYILTSAHTFSGGEEFAYNMAALKRATVIGEATAGSANPASIDIISDEFYATIPHATPTNPVTGTNWEGCGVIPHIEICADQALTAAHTHALSRLIDNKVNETTRTKLQWLLEEAKNGYHPIEVPLSVLERYVGRYGDTEVLLESDHLVYKRRFFRYQLIPLSQTVFWLDGPAAGFEPRVEFVKDESGRISHLARRFPDGRPITLQPLTTVQ